MNDNCDCATYYFLGGSPRCLHKLFADGDVKAMTREVTREGVEFLIWLDRLEKNKRGRYAGTYKLFGWRSKLSSRDQILLALDLAKKYNIQRVRL